MGRPLGRCVAGVEHGRGHVVRASELHAATGPNASLFGAQTTQFTYTTDSGTVKCTQFVLEGTAASQTPGTTTAQELTITPQYTGCVAFGLASIIDMNGCEYTVTGAGQPALTAVVDIVCNKTVGKVIEITAAAGCVVTVPPQSAGGHLVFKNSGADITAEVTLANLQYEGHGPCPSLPATVLTTNGIFNGGLTIQARKDQGSVQATHNGHTYQKLLQNGPLVALAAT
jgi:hypothetical protein